MNSTGLGIALIFIPFLILLTPAIGFYTGHIFRILKIDKPIKKGRLILTLAIMWLLWIAALTVSYLYWLFSISPITIPITAAYFIFSFLIAYRKWNWQKTVIGFLLASIIIFFLIFSI